MTDDKPSRRPKSTGSISQRKSDLRWVGTIDLESDSGTRDRKYVYVNPRLPNGKMMTDDQAIAAVDRKLTLLKRELVENGGLIKNSPKLEDWLDKWLSIAQTDVRPKTFASYRSTVEQYLKPSIGRVRLDKLTPEHVEKAHKYVIGKGLSTRTASLTYQVLSLALDTAVNYNKITRNPAKRVKRPRTKKNAAIVLTASEANKVMATVANDALGSRIFAAFHTGARQSELLGLEWDRVYDITNAETGETTTRIELSWQLQNFSWQHGCKTPCGRTASACPKRTVNAPADYEMRHLTGVLWLTRPKSKAGFRTITLVEPLKSMINARREFARMEPNPFNLVWTRPNGNPWSHRADNRYWEESLVRAGFPSEGKKPYATLHSARHTAASLSAKSGSRIEVIQKVLGHSTAAMSRNYMEQDVEQITAAMVALSEQYALADSPVRVHNDDTL